MSRFVLLAAALLFTAPALADQTGIAFVYAAEQGAGVCTGGSPDKAFACAKKKCAESGAAEADCARLAWCFPSGWSAGIGVMHKEGIHWSEFICGWPTKEAAAAAAKLRCASMDKSFINECSAGVFYDPEGKEIAAE